MRPSLTWLIYTVGNVAIRYFEKYIHFRYGFVTFEKPEDVENVMRQGKLYFCGKKLNLGPAVRKQVL